MSRYALLALAVAGLLLFTKWQATSWNDQSRMATVQALVEHGTFAIDRTDFIGTGDKVFVQGRFFSDKPCMPSLVGALVYWPLFHLGVELEVGPSLAHYLITLTVIGLPWLLAMLALYASLARLGISERVCLWNTAALALGSLLLPWSTVFSNHSFAAAWIAIGLWGVLQLRGNETRLGLYLLSGFALSLAGAADVPTTIFFAGFAVMLLVDPMRRRALPWFLLPSLTTLGPMLAVNYSISGSFVPLQTVVEYFNYPGSSWANSTALSGVATNTPSFALDYGLMLLLGTKGFLWFNPLLWLALPGILSCMRRGSQIRHEALVIAAGSTILFLYYILRTNGYGGWTYGARWLIPLLPLHYFFLHAFLRGTGGGARWRWRIFAVALAPSTCIALLGMPLPYQNVQTNLEWWIDLLPF